jgi:hypothetical protein
MVLKNLSFESLGKRYRRKNNGMAKIRNGKTRASAYIKKLTTFLDDIRFSCSNTWIKANAVGYHMAYQKV